MLISVLIVFIVCWTPRVLQNFSRGLTHWSGLDPGTIALNDFDMHRLTISLRMFSYVNSIVNALIYYATSQ